MLHAGTRGVPRGTMVTLIAALHKITPRQHDKTAKAVVEVWHAHQPHRHLILITCSPYTMLMPSHSQINEDEFDVWFHYEVSRKKGKWQAIVEDIRRFHDAGRPVLVGTTSVDKSEMLSQMLTRETRIEHEVLQMAKEGPRGPR